MPARRSYKGSLIAHAGDKNIPLPQDNRDPFFVVQPVITTKGFADDRQRHFNTYIRCYMTVSLTDDRIFFQIWPTTGTIADVPSTSARPEAVLVNRGLPDSEIPENRKLIFELPDETETRLRAYIRNNAVPYIAQLLAFPFENVVKEKLERAAQSKDRLRKRVLQRLYKDNAYFSFTDPRPEKMRYLPREVIEAPRVLLEKQERRIEQRLQLN